MALFEFETQAGITHVLASIRASKISPAQKNELRDIVFLYANGGHDQTVKLSLEQKLSSYNIEAVSKAYIPPKAPMYTIGGTRQTPVDFSIVNTVKSSPNPTPVATSVPAPVAPVVPVIPPSPQPVVAATPAPVVPIPQPQPVVVPTAVVPQPAPYVPPPVIPQTPATPQAQSPFPAPTPNPTPVDFPPSGEQQLQRIREIKSLVNEQVGNPVNLIDIDNEAGREYMGALLDAMKKLNTGTSSVAAMQRLEQAYLAVDAAIKRHKGLAAQSNVKPLAQPLPVQPTPVAPYIPPAPVVPPPQPVVAATPASVVPIPQPRPVQPPPAPYVAPVINSAPTPVAINRQTPPPAPPAPPTQPRPVPPPLPPTPKPVVPPPIVERSPEPVSQESGADAWESNKPSTSAYADSKLTSLAESKLRAQPPVAPVSSAPAAPTDPLFAKEIDDGLEQLLSEWSLFKKSGLFGTGPKGREHPLFKKVAGLQIPLLLAGRFEGATQEIKQSITDYMNGWRYEQGIIYMPGETFERYLRRVIRHILDLQKKPVRS